MPIKVLMPALSPTMTEGKLASWKKKEGDTVKSGDVLAEIETDKATMEVEAVDEGTLGKILIAAGTEGVKVNQPIALILEEGEDKSALAAAANGGAASAPEAPKKAPEPAKPAAAPPPAAPAAQAPRAAAPAAPAGMQTAAASPSPAGRVFASPLAKRMAEQAGVDLS